MLDSITMPVHPDDAKGTAAERIRKRKKRFDAFSQNPKTKIKIWPALSFRADRAHSLTPLKTLTYRRHSQWKKEDGKGFALERTDSAFII